MTGKHKWYTWLRIRNLKLLFVRELIFKYWRFQLAGDQTHNEYLTSWEWDSKINRSFNERIFWYSHACPSGWKTLICCESVTPLSRLSSLCELEEVELGRNINHHWLLLSHWTCTTAHWWILSLFDPTIHPWLPPLSSWFYFIWLPPLLLQKLLWPLECAA